MSVLSPFDKKVDVKEKPEKKSIRNLFIEADRSETGKTRERQRLSNKEKNPTNFVKKKYRKQKRCIL